MSHAMMTIRAFLAVEVGPVIHAALIDLKRELQHTDAAVRWVRDDGLHATIKFLGAVSESVLPEIRAALDEALASTPRLDALARGVGAFPSPARPRIVWAGIECAGLRAVAAATDEALEPLGFARESRPYHPHVTLGRVTGRDPRGRLRAAIETHRDDVFGACAIGGLAAYRSDLRRGGAVYTKLWTVPFGG